MEEVKVNKTELLKTIKENREKHIQLYKDAYEGFMIQAKSNIKKELAHVQSGKEPRNLSFHAPVNHEAQYDEAIRMLEMSVDKEITLTRYEFSQYVQDSWVSANEKTMMRAMALSSSNALSYK